ncbi:extracellular catalytic domain type 1 short-chain-length polyhydroxyalkanoate depolymerase [Methylobacterium oryzisoli]|uniref:extracellular catalytic domain type 1 short-chain-length polyhydroxyalkanoate depolymerase n=1 Tax=Methylobacterium oryzisoli TaxID=3385502 RepID=UPI00389266DE
MRNKRLPGMAEATRLTREGRLGEAMALIQRAVRGAPAAPPEPGPRSLRLPPPEGTPPAGPAPSEPAPSDRAPSDRAPSWTGPALPDLQETLRKAMREVGRTVGPLFEGVAEPAPRPATEPGRFLDLSFANAEGQRAYKLYVPSGYDGRPVPLVVMLHGCTQNPDDFAAGTGMNGVAEAETFLVAYPAQTAAANHARCWNWFVTADQRRDQGEASLIAGIARAVMAEYAVDADRVYVAGLSAGGAAAANLAAAYPDLFAAVGVHSGLCAGAAHDLPSALRAMRQGGECGSSLRDPLPTIVFHGDQDGTVHPRNGEAIIAATGATPLREEAGVSPGGRAWRRRILADGRGRPAHEHWVVEGSGHAWSGGTAAGSYTDPQGPDAAREMWRFFREHPKPRR